LFAANGGVVDGKTSQLGRKYTAIFRQTSDNF